MSYHYREFQPETDALKPFDCGKADMNGFLLETSSDTPNATMYEREHLGKTYIVEDDDSGSILAYFCLLYDSPYSKCKFRTLVVPDPKDETVLMSFDLKSLS